MIQPATLIRSAPFWLLSVSTWPLAPIALAAPQPLDQSTPNAPSNAGELFTEAFFLKLGFSFMIGLAMGFALKVAFKIALIVMGLILLGVFGLQYAGLVEVNWSGIEGHYDSWIAGLSVIASAFFAFVGDNLSSAASFLAGLAVGLKF